MNTDDVDDVLPGPPNDGAYEADELRTGPPLSYVAEKFRHCLEGLHGAIGKIETAAKVEADQEDRVGFQEKYAFHSAVVGSGTSVRKLSPPMSRAKSGTGSTGAVA